MLSLRALAADPAGCWPAERVLCRDGDTGITWGDICRRIDRYREEFTAFTGEALALHRNRADELLAALIAAWQLNRTAVVGKGDGKSDITAPVELPASIHSQPALVMYTSGSSGDPLPVPKSLTQLDAELQLLETAWGEDIGDSVFVSTVSRHHMYGLPFSLLWPLARGNAFSRASLHFLENLPTAVGERPIILVASPVQLANLPVQLNRTELKKRVVQVFSAGAPLSPAAATASLDHLGCPVTEIFGSTETGAIAWQHSDRQQDWQCLPGVSATLAEDGERLRVCSPALEGGDGQWQTLMDTAEIRAPGRFQLLGRVDSIVKVGGKRISLAAIDRALQSHPWVVRARALQLRERKDRIGAVVVLTAEGNVTLIDRGKPAVRKELASHLAQMIDPVALPRYWRFVSALPVTREGKIPSDVLQDLFITTRQPRLPEVLDRRSTEPASSAVFELFVPYQLYYFNGHFPSNGVLPGVVQIDWAIHYAEQCFDGLGYFRRLEVLKFQQVIQPGQAVTLTLRRDPARDKLAFEFTSPGARHASGRIVFGHD